MRLRITENDAAYLARQAAVQKASRSLFSSPDIYPEADESFLIIESEDGQTTYEFTDDPLIDVRKRKKVVVTEVVEGNSEVIEVISNLGSEITIKGKLVDEQTHLYPEKAVKELDNICKVNTMVKPFSKKLNALGISFIYILSVDFPTTEGTPDTQEYSITARSTRPPELTLFEL